MLRRIQLRHNQFGHTLLKRRPSPAVSVELMLLDEQVLDLDKVAEARNSVLGTEGSEIGSAPSSVDT